MASRTNTNKIIIPSNILEELKCAFCNQHLSVPTVTVHHIKEGCYICGRCTEKFQNLSGVRASAYEALAQLFLFPCRYYVEGCKRNLSWGGVLDHETSCEFRNFECPSLPFQSCKWTGTVKNLIPHFQQRHVALYMDKPYFSLPIKNNVEMNKILFALNEVFLVQTISEVDKFYICVKYIGKPPDSGKFCYEIEMKATSQENVLKICSKTTKPVLKYDMDKKNMNEINIIGLTAIMKTKNIICAINILEKKPEPKKEQLHKVVKKPSTEVGKSEVSDVKLVKELECPICQECMFPPIFICGTGHSVCGNCKEKIKRCPKCLFPYSGARNYTLEKLTEVVNYLCKNNKQGCKFTGTFQEIRNHEISCRSHVIKCPLEIPEKCNWEGSFGKIKKHVNQCHNENSWINLNDGLFRNLTSTSYADFHIIPFENELFKICCKHSKSEKGPVVWSFQHIGLAVNDKPKYKCEIEFVDVNDNGRKLIVNDLCYGLKEHKFIFDQALSIPYDLLFPFINKDSCLIFKYNMAKV